MDATEKITKIWTAPEQQECTGADRNARSCAWACMIGLKNRKNNNFLFLIYDF